MHVKNMKKSKHLFSIKIKIKIKIQLKFRVSHRIKGVTVSNYKHSYLVATEAFFYVKLPYFGQYKC